MVADAPWDLRRRGLTDARRHDQRVKEAIRKNLQHLIAEETIISSRGRRKIKVPIRYLDPYRFKYDESTGERGVGTGPGQPGEILPGESGDRGGAEAGDRPGDLVYEAEVTVEDLTRIMLEDLELPWLEAKPRRRDAVEELRFDEVRRRGSMTNIDKRRTLYNNIKRHAARAEARVGPFVDDDLRFKTWRQREERRSQAATYLLMDRSASMSSEKKYIAKSFFFWLVRFLELKYDDVELVFIAHDVEAEVVSEQDFFRVSNSGGTKCSSAYQLALRCLEEDHPPSLWNSYVFHFSDGDNFPSDNERCVETVQALLEQVRMVGYGEIAVKSWDDFYRLRRRQEPERSVLGQALAAVAHPRFLSVLIHRREDIHKALQAFLKEEGSGDLAAVRRRT